MEREWCVLSAASKFARCPADRCLARLSLASLFVWLQASELRYTANTQTAQLHARYTGPYTLSDCPSARPVHGATLQTLVLTPRVLVLRNRSRRLDQIVRPLTLSPRSSSGDKQLTLPLASAPRSEWMTNQHRDTSSSIVGHPALLQYLSVADGEATARTKFELTEVRITSLSQLASSRASGLTLPCPSLTAHAPTVRPPATKRGRLAVSFSPLGSYLASCCNEYPLPCTDWASQRAPTSRVLAVRSSEAEEERAALRSVGAAARPKPHEGMNKMRGGTTSV